MRVRFARLKLQEGRKDAWAIPSNFNFESEPTASCQWDIYTHPTGSTIQYKTSISSVDLDGLVSDWGDHWNSRLRQIWTARYGQPPTYSSHAFKIKASTEAKDKSSSSLGAENDGNSNKGAASTTTDKGKMKQQQGVSEDLPDVQLILDFAAGRELEEQQYIAVGKFLKAKHQLATEPPLLMLQTMTLHCLAKGKDPETYSMFETYVKDNKKTSGEAEKVAEKNVKPQASPRQAQKSYSTPIHCPVYDSESFPSDSNSSEPPSRYDGRW